MKIGGSSTRIFGLDFMRAVAILLVVCSHALWAFPQIKGSFQALLDFMGMMGVEIFFVLSGFLIGRILLRIFTSPDFKSRHLTYFLIRRWFRTLPNYYLILLINILIVWYLGREFADSLPLYFGFLQNFNFGMDIFFTESWSLPVEEFAYILGPLLLYLLFFLKLPVSRNLLFLGITLSIILFFLGTKIAYHLQHDSTTMEYWNIHLKAVVIYRIDAIYYGVLAAYISKEAPRFWKNQKRRLFKISLLSFCLLQYAIGAFGLTFENTPMFINVFYLPVTSIIIALSLPFLSQWQKAPNWLIKPITFISLISYAMYLLHYSIVLQLMRYWIPIKQDSILYTLIFSVGYAVITIVLSYGLYRIYEKPMMDIRDQPFVKKRF